LAFRRCHNNSANSNDVSVFDGDMNEGNDAEGGGNNNDETKIVEDIFEKAYRNFKAPSGKDDDSEKVCKARLNYALLAVCKKHLIIAAILLFFEDAQNQRIPETALERYRGYWLSCLLFLFISLKAVSEATFFHQVNRCAWRIKTAISSSVYCKSLRLAASSEQRQHTSFGEMANLMQIDATKVEAFVPQCHSIWDGIFQIAGYMTILGLIIGWPCVIGLILMILTVPVMAKVMSQLMTVNRSMVKHTDDRVKTANEALQGIRCVKMYTWEESFAEQITSARSKELNSLTTSAYLRAFSGAYMTALPIITAVVTFLTINSL